jgi:hypothetical protein
MHLRPVLMVIVLTGSAWAQAGPAPGPEVQKLDYFVGTWTGEGTVPSGPWGAGGKYSVTHTQQWLDGRFFLLCHSEVKMPSGLGGEMISDGFTGFDLDKKQYISIGVDSRGGHGETHGSLDGDTWTWTDSATYNGKEIHQRETNKMLSPNSYRAVFEVSDDGVKWTVMMDTIVTKK